MEAVRDAISECIFIEDNSSRCMEDTDENFSDFSSDGEDMIGGYEPMEFSSDGEEDMIVGYRHLEVFSVQFIDYKMEEIYGLILLDCACVPYILFERFPGDYLPIDSNGFVELTDPSDVPSADTRIEFYAFLTDLEGRGKRSDNNFWNPLKRLRMRNMLLSYRFQTMFGPLEVNFAVFTLSAEAVLEVKLLDWKHNGNEIEVFGTITARTKVISDERAKSYMFKREKRTCAMVKPGEAIPLSRSYLVFPVKSSIILDVHLFRPSDKDSEADDLIVNGCVEIRAARRGEEFVLAGDSARIQLKIT